MSLVSQFAFRPTAGTVAPDLLPITDIQAQILMFKGVEHFSNTADALLWVHRKRTPKQALALVHVLGLGYALVGYAER